MKIGFEKRQRIAKIFGRVAEYTVSILILGAIITGRGNALIVLVGFVVFAIFLLISVSAEPIKEKGA